MCKKHQLFLHIDKPLPSTHNLANFIKLEKPVKTDRTEIKLAGPNSPGIKYHNRGKQTCFAHFLL